MLLVILASAVGSVCGCDDSSIVHEVPLVEGSQQHR